MKTTPSITFLWTHLAWVCDLSNGYNNTSA